MAMRRRKKQPAGTEATPELWIFKQKITQPSRWWGVAGIALTSPALIGFSIRFADAVWFDVGLHRAGLSPMILIGLNITVSLLLLRMASRRPLLGGSLAILLFELAKLRADSASSPTLSCGQRRCVSIITGGNSGIGLATAEALALQGHEIILGCRAAEACNAARAAVASHGVQQPVHAAPGLDLASLSAVHAWVSVLPASRVDFLFNNAGFVPVGNETTVPCLGL